MSRPPRPRVPAPEPDLSDAPPYIPREGDHPALVAAWYTANVVPVMAHLRVMAAMEEHKRKKEGA